LAEGLRDGHPDPHGHCAAPDPGPGRAAMSPVQQTNVRDPRSLALAIGGLLVGVVLLLVVFVYAVPKMTEQGNIRLSTPGSLSLGSAEVKAELIRNDAPLLFPDPTGGQADIYVQHLGDDPLTGWLAFDARRAGTGRECNLVWNRDTKVFDDPCGGAPVPADGGDLRRMRIEVDEEKQLALILMTPATRPITGSMPVSTTR
jgi:hypothetical protein